MNLLGIETSCDETSAAVHADGWRILSNVIATQADLHARWGGVVPEAASRRHVEVILPVIQEALDTAGLRAEDIDGIAVTNRPGLVGALLVGISTAKAMAYALKKPIAAVHHLEGHLYSNFLADSELEFPFLCLIVSGGHTELVFARGHGELETIGRTVDDAAGECFDKCARLMGLPYPGGPSVDRLAAAGNAKDVSFPRAWMGDSLDFSFSGLKTAVSRFIERDQGETLLPDVAASFQAAVVEVLVSKTVRAAQETAAPTVCVAGGVAANRGLKAEMSRACAENGLMLVIPPSELCTDNAAMIAAAGSWRLERGESDTLDFDTYASQPLAKVRKTIAGAAA
jgi:N6-L-threonylcarbamoyladenine synthase